MTPHVFPVVLPHLAPRTRLSLIRSRCSGMSCKKAMNILHLSVSGWVELPSYKADNSLRRGSTLAIWLLRAVKVVPVPGISQPCWEILPPNSQGGSCGCSSDLEASEAFSAAAAASEIAFRDIRPPIFQGGSSGPGNGCLSGPEASEAFSAAAEASEIAFNTCFLPVVFACHFPGNL
jgi:hypothetical protein